MLAKIKQELLYRRFIIILLLFSCSKVFSQNTDIRLLRTLYTPEAVRSDGFFRFLSDSEVYLIISTPTAIFAAGRIGHDKKLLRDGCVTMASTIVNVVVSNALKYSVNRERPFITYPDIIKKTDCNSPSFPSGHTANAFATATSLSLVYPEWYIIIPSFVYAGTVGYARMHLGVHYPSDVLAGAAIGAGCAYLTHKVNKLLLNKRKIKPCNCPDL
jgi:membrane-associated phospholipid phosphatase